MVVMILLFGCLVLLYIVLFTLYVYCSVISLSSQPSVICSVISLSSQPSVAQPSYGLSVCLHVHVEVCGC